MFSAAKKSTHQALLCLMLSSLVACGGSDNSNDGEGPYGGTPEPTATPTPTSTPEPTATPLAVPLQKSATNAGKTFVGAGNVEILVPDEAEESFVTAVEDRTSMTLYVRDNDELGESSCNSVGCVNTWPPLLASEDATAELPMTIIEREDGAMQWALRDKPLYFFSGDSEAGDINGEGKGGFHVALSQPVAIGDNESDGQFFVGFGSTLVSAPEGGLTDSFITERKEVSGLTLYTFVNDTSGVSNCFGPCLAAWPALLADAGDTATAPFSLIERQMDTEGGTALQWAYRGKALYYFAGDSQAGDTNGLANASFPLARPIPWKVADSIHGSIFAATGLVLEANVDEEVEGEEITSVAGRDGFTLYTRDTDDGASTCFEACLENWPAFMAHAGASNVGPFSLIARESGDMQWALNGQPLYFFAGDANPGDVNGDGIAGIFHAARTVPVAVLNHETEGAIFTGHGSLIDKEGNADESFVGFTLYTFEQDDQGVSTCFGGCEANWPPLFASEGARAFGDFTVIDRDDPNTADDDDAGIKQWAYKGAPLYFFINDSAPGEATGEHETWFIARP